MRHHHWHPVLIRNATLPPSLVRAKWLHTDRLCTIAPHDTLPRPSVARSLSVRPRSSRMRSGHHARFGLPMVVSDNCLRGDPCPLPQPFTLRLHSARRPRMREVVSESRLFEEMRQARRVKTNDEFRDSRPTQPPCIRLSRSEGREETAEGGGVRVGVSPREPIFKNYFDRKCPNKTCHCERESSCGRAFGLMRNDFKASGIPACSARGKTPRRLFTSCFRR